MFPLPSTGTHKLYMFMHLTYQQERLLCHQHMRTLSALSAKLPCSSGTYKVPLHNGNFSCAILRSRLWTLYFRLKRPVWCIAILAYGFDGQNWRRIHSVEGIRVPSGSRCETMFLRSSIDIVIGRYMQSPCLRSWTAAFSTTSLSTSSQRASNCVDSGLSHQL